MRLFYLNSREANTVKSDSGIVKRLMSYIRPYSFALLCSLLCAVISVLLTLLAPILIGKGVDLLIGKDQVNFKGILRILLQLVFTVIGASLFQWLLSYCNNVLSFKVSRDLRVKAFTQIAGIRLKYIDSTPHGDIINRVVNDIDMVSEGLLQGFTQLFTGVFTILFTVVFMLRVNIPIALAVVFLTPLSIFVAGFIAKGSHKYFTSQTKTQGEILGLAEEMIAGQKVLNTFDYQNTANQGFEHINEELYHCGMRAHFYSAMANPCTRFVNNMVYATVAVFGAILVIGQKGISVGDLTVFLTYANQYTKPFNEISGIITQLQSAFASLTRVFALLDEPKEPAVLFASSRRLLTAEGKVDLDHVSFSYNDSVKMIEDLNISVKPGERVAIVGPTGCGKTTLINLLMRFYDIQGGKITIDTVDVNEVPREDVRSKFGMILQESWLFNGTVRENIAYGNPNASEEEVISAAKRAHAHNFIMRLPDGYDTVLSDDLQNISQGQKQLLCIARVMLINPPMLILDEATSNIDTRTEIKIQRAFYEMMQGKTSFVVAHRLSTIRDADKILVMKNGAIIEQGTHFELISSGGFYAQLYAAMLK